MSEIKLDKKAFQKLINEDITYLNEVCEENSLERKHIVECLDILPDLLYPAWINDELKSARKLFDEWITLDDFSEFLTKPEIEERINGFLKECVQKGVIKLTPIEAPPSVAMNKPILGYEHGN